MALKRKQTSTNQVTLIRPFVTVLIPMRNERDNIALCLDSVLLNDYPSDQIEVLVIDGASTDTSIDIVNEYAKHHQSIHVLTNLKRFQAAALNLGLKRAKGDLVLRLDAHTVYAKDYISRCVELLLSRNASNVGGVQRAVGNTYFTKAVATTINSRLVIGDAKFRYADKEMWVDTVYLGAWQKQTLESLNGFDERWVVNEDYELNYRLRRTGGKILLSPTVQSWYTVRNSQISLARQYFRYGYWRVKTLVSHPESARWRQLAPAILTVGLTVSPLAYLLNWMLGIMIPILYFLYLTIATSEIGWTSRLRYIPILPIIVTTIHLSMGLGFLLGLVRWGIPQIGKRTIINAFTKGDEDSTTKQRKS